MRIVTERRLKEFWQAASGSERQGRETVMRKWISVVRKENWQTFSDIRKTFNHCDAYCNCVIFDIGGNKYRIIAKPAYKVKLLFIRAVLTHAKYDEKKWQADCK